MAGDNIIPDEGAPGEHMDTAGVEAARERVRVSKEIKHEDESHGVLVQQIVRGEMGDVEYFAGRRWYDSLPESERIEIANAKLSDGTPLLQDPDAIQALYKKAIGDIPTKREDIDAELAKLKAKIGTSEWYKSEADQARYRALLRAKSVK